MVVELIDGIQSPNALNENKEFDCKDYRQFLSTLVIRYLNFY